MPVVPTFRWWGLARDLVVLNGILGWLAWGDYGKSGNLDLLYPILAAWGTLFIAYRWGPLRRKQSDDTLSVEKHRAASGYLRLSTKELLFWGGALFLAVIVLVAYQMASGHP